MHVGVPRMLRMVALIATLKNRAINFVARALTGRRVSMDWRGLRVLHPESMQIGNAFSAGQGLWLESVGGRGRLVIGSDVNMSDYVHVGCALSVTIGNGVLIGSKVLITDHSHGHIDPQGPRDLDLMPNQRPIVSKGPVVIGDRVWLGDGVCVLAGVCIGAGAIIGANSIVTKDIPPDSIWAGVPARQVWPQV